MNIKSDFFKLTHYEMKSFKYFDYKNYYVITKQFLIEILFPNLSVKQQQKILQKAKKLNVWKKNNSIFEKDVLNIFEHSFSEEMQDKINFFYFRGAFDYSKLSPIDKLLMLGLKCSLKMKKEELFVDPKNPTAKPIVGVSSTTKSTLAKAGMKMVSGTSDAK